MSMNKVGIYFQELRLSKQLSQRDVAAVVGVSDRIISAWERGEHAPKIDVLPRLLEKLGGAWDDVQRLMEDDSDVDLARLLAKRRINHEGLTEEQREFLENLSPEQRSALLAFAQQMIEH